MIVVLMGVSGSGKTTIGRLLSEKTGAVFADADDYHPERNKLKMAAGQALDDGDRQPWLLILNGVIRGWYESGASGVLACSALKESYRETLADGMPSGAVTFCLLELSRKMLEKRLEERHHEFMTAKLLDSQLATLEEPTDAIVVRNNRDPHEVVGEIVNRIAGEKE